jgi:hypothetical protein
MSARSGPSITETCTIAPKHRAASIHEEIDVAGRFTCPNTLRLALRHSGVSTFTSLAEKLPSLAITAIERKLAHSGVILETVIRYIQYLSAL